MQISINKTNPSFCSNGRFYESNGDSFGCNSWLFREDLDWKKTAGYEAALFRDKDKVNIEMYAASDGSEGYTKMISLYEHFGEDNPEAAAKFFPIMAYDIDDEILRAARSGLLKTCLADRMNMQMYCENYEDYFEPTDKKLDIMDDIKLQSEKTLKVKDKLTSNIKFIKGDMFQKIKELKDESNTILMCRNILGYFLNDKIEEFIKSASEVLKRNSLFEIGDHDVKFFDINSCMESYGFKRVLKNVYKKL